MQQKKESESETETETDGRTDGRIGQDECLTVVGSGVRAGADVLIINTSFVRTSVRTHLCYLLGLVRTCLLLICFVSAAKLLVPSSLVKTLGTTEIC